MPNDTQDDATPLLGEPGVDRRAALAMLRAADVEFNDVLSQLCHSLPLDEEEVVLPAVAYDDQVVLLGFSPPELRLLRSLRASTIGTQHAAANAFSREIGDHVGQAIDLALEVYEPLLSGSMGPPGLPMATLCLLVGRVKHAVNVAILTALIEANDESYAYRDDDDEDDEDGPGYDIDDEWSAGLPRSGESGLAIERVVRQKLGYGQNNPTPAVGAPNRARPIMSPKKA